MRRGFAIPAVIMTLAVMSIMIAAGFMLVNAEERGVGDQKAQVTAFLLAEQGLQTFLVRRDSLGFRSNPPAAREGSVRIQLSGGYADVQLDRVRTPTSLLLGLYAIRARGVGAGNPPAIRTVAQYAEWQPVSLSLNGAWTALTGVKRLGLLASVRGADLCGDSASLPGIAVPSTILGGLSIAGLVDSVRNLGANATQAAASVPMQWRSIVEGTGLVPNYTIPPNSIPSFADTTAYPIVKIVGDLTSGAGLNGGRGLLIVTGNIDMNSTTLNWKGLILVGGAITGNFSGAIEGAVISGLNVKLGMSVGSNTADGLRTIRYNSCAVANALKGVGSLVPVSNAWADNWIEY